VGGVTLTLTGTTADASPFLKKALNGVFTGLSFGGTVRGRLLCACSTWVHASVAKATQVTNTFVGWVCVWGAFLVFRRTP